MRKIVSLIMAFCLILLSLFNTGCAAQASKMVPADFDVSSSHPYSVKVEDVYGGHETNPLWTSQISDSAFLQALKDSLDKSGVFETLVESGESDYKLTVSIVDYSKPVMGLDFDVAITSKWTLDCIATKKVVYNDEIKTSYKAKLGDALVAAERLQKANEGAVRTNIKEGIKRLSELDL